MRAWPPCAAVPPFRFSIQPNELAVCSGTTPRTGIAVSTGIIVV